MRGASCLAGVAERDAHVARRIAPRDVAARHGHASAADALALAGGVPSSAPETPLLVVVNDPARATPTADALRALAPALGSRSVRVLVATGSHVHDAAARARHEAPLRAALGTPCDVRWHEGADERNVAVGDELCDPWLAEARDVVGIGSVEPHWFAGLTGAWKTLSVGVLARSGIARSHRRATEPGARPFALAGNPVHDAIVATLHALLADRRVLALDALGGRWSAGPPLATLEACAADAVARWRHTVPAPLDHLVLRVDAPLDAELYQAEKAIKNSEHAVRDGGAIVLDAACARGVGPRRFVDLLAAAPDAAAARAHVARAGYALGDHKALRLRDLQARGVRLAVVSSALAADDLRAAGFDALPSCDAVAPWLRAQVGDGARGATVEDAAHCVVEVAT